jgi:hypothetical protein
MKLDLETYECRELGLASDIESNTNFDIVNASLYNLNKGTSATVSNLDFKFRVGKEYKLELVKLEVDESKIFDNRLIYCIEAISLLDNCRVNLILTNKFIKSTANNEYNTTISLNNIAITEEALDVFNVGAIVELFIKEA